MGKRIDSRDSSLSSWSRQPGSTSLKKDLREFSTPQSSVVSSIVIVEKGNEKKSLAEGPAEASKARYLERVKNLDLEEACRMELMDTLELISFSHEYLSSHYCVDWLKAHEAHFSRERTMETADLTGIPRVSTFDPVNYRPLKELRPKHRTGIARIKIAIPAQLRAVEELLDPRSMGLHDTAYSSPKLAEDPRYGEEYGTSQLAQALATYGRSDPGAAKVVIVARSDFAGTSDQLFWPGTLVYLLKVAELNQI